MGSPCLGVNPGPAVWVTWSFNLPAPGLPPARRGAQHLPWGPSQDVAGAEQGQGRRKLGGAGRLPCPRPWSLLVPGG